jgi:hypothetical protein
MSKSALPTATDLTNLFSSVGITLSGSFDAASVMASAITTWNRNTGYNPFFQASNTALAIPFDPPGPDATRMTRGGRQRLLLTNGLISLTSLYVGVNAAGGSSGTQLILGQDFWLYPNDAQTASNPGPYTRIDFAYVQRGLPQSVVVTGVWGYGLNTIPDDAWEGILLLAGSMAARSILQGIFATPTTIKDDDVTITQDSFRDLGTAWEQRSWTIMQTYILEQ